MRACYNRDLNPGSLRKPSSQPLNYPDMPDSHINTDILNLVRKVGSLTK